MTRRQDFRDQYARKRAQGRNLVMPWPLGEARSVAPRARRGADAGVILF